MNSLATALNLSNDLACTIDLNGRILEINKNWSTLLFFEKNDTIGKSFSSLVHTHDLNIFSNEFREAVEQIKNSNTQISFKIKLRLLNNKKSYTSFDFNFSYVESEKAFTAFGKDITELVRLKKLSTQHEKVSKIGSWEIDLNTKDLFWSDMTYQIHEMDPDKYKPKLEDGISFYHPDSQPELQNAIQEMMSTGKHYDLELKFITGKGRNIWVRAISHAEMKDGHVTSLYGTFEDITEKKHQKDLIEIENQNIRSLQKELIASHNELDTLKQRLEIAVSAVQFGVWDWDLKNNILVWDKLMYQIFEIDKEDFNGDIDAFNKTLVPEDAKRIHLELGEIYKYKQTVFESEFRVITKNGKIKTISAKASCFYDSKGAIERMVGANWDVSELRISESNLKNANAQIEKYFSVSIDLLCVAGTDGYLKRVNPSFSTTLGFSEHELLSQPFINFVHPDDIQETYTEIEKLRSGRPSVQFENRYITKSGDYKFLSWTVSPDTESDLLYCAVRDMTETKKDALARMHSSKMASLGEMAGGIAHEINNPLAIIHGKSSQILRNFEKSQNENKDIEIDKVKIELKKIISTSERIAKIIRGLRSFSRDSSADPMENCKFDSIIDDTIELCKERFKNHNIDLLLLGYKPYELNCRPTQITQVLLNLLNNAHDAIRSLEEKWIRVDMSEESGILKIKVVDSGDGIPEQIAAKIMNPFFTTKEVGKGTGLGLSISKGLIEDHNGKLYYDNTAKNTTFVIELPLPTKSISKKNAS
jgi:PAS domain S-box-containing protein